MGLIMLVLVVGGVMLLVCRSYVPAEAEEHSYVNSQYRFALDLPKGWSGLQSGFGVFRFEGPKKGDRAAPVIRVSVTSRTAADFDVWIDENRDRLSWSKNPEARFRRIRHPNGHEAFLTECGCIRYYCILTDRKQYEMEVTSAVRSSMAEQWHLEVGKVFDSLIVW